MKRLFTKITSIAKYSIPFMTFGIVIVIASCSSTPQLSSANRPNDALHQPKDKIYNQADSFENTVPINNDMGSRSSLPLGIGAQFDLFTSNAASDVTTFYNTIIRPVRSGKFFSRQPYVVDYGILPDDGDVIDFQDNQNQVNIQSNYQLRLGMSRKFNHFSDFLKADFWLAKGQYSPSYKKNIPTPEVDPFSLGQFERRENFDLHSERSAEFDYKSIIQERWLEK